MSITQDECKLGQVPKDMEMDILRAIEQYEIEGTRQVANPAPLWRDILAIVQDRIAKGELVVVPEGYVCRVYLQEREGELRCKECEFIRGYAMYIDPCPGCGSKAKKT